LAGLIGLEAVVDDYTEDKSFCGLPVIRGEEIPRGGIVLNAAGGRPLTAKRHLDKLGVANVDYFWLLRSGVPGLPDVVFNEGFRADYAENRPRYEDVLARLSDEESKTVMSKLIAFRLNLDLDDLEGFTDSQAEQYFEPFLRLATSGECFVDVGGFDGYTSRAFALRCPDYAAIHLLEPDPRNMVVCRKNLKEFPNVHFYECAASDGAGRASMVAGGSTSAILANGDTEIHLRRLDDLDITAPTFVKIDTEGFEREALLGMERLLAEHHPRIAVSIYHKAGDFWRIPELVLSMQPNYRIYVRHYTESIYETVMFFLPVK
jgi:FkbM family methyltransferase